MSDIKRLAEEALQLQNKAAMEQALKAIIDLCVDHQVPVEQIVEQKPSKVKK